LRVRQQLQRLIAVRSAGTPETWAGGSSREGDTMATEIHPGTTACWSCGQGAESAHFCDQCRKVQPAVPMDYFRFFGLERKLDLDLARLEREFYRLSRRLHPDLYARASAEERGWSLVKSSQLNDAYRTLKDPIARTQYLLELEGVKLVEQSSAATAAARESGREKKQIVPPELLEEVFELNMQLQELRSGEAGAEVRAGLDAARTRFEAALEATTAELKQLWHAWDAAQDDDERAAVRQRMVALLNRRSYIRNLVRDVHEALGA
jgi:molecular chaperone HscB